MNINEIKNRIEEIKHLAICDDEGAHSKEDDLYCDFIKFIAESDISKFSVMAKSVLKTSEIFFKRVCS